MSPTQPINKFKMSDQTKRENCLRKLLEDNFKASKICRQIMEAFSDPGLKQYFQKLSSKRGQFAIELGDEIIYFGGKEAYVPSRNFVQWPSSSEENRRKYLKKALKLHKQSLENYKAALSQVNDGSCREILIRHKAFMEKCVFEIKALQALVQLHGDHRSSSGNALKEH